MGAFLCGLLVPRLVFCLFVVFVFLFGFVLFWYECLSHLSSEFAGRYPLDRDCDWCCGEQSLHWMLGAASSFICGYHSLPRVVVCTPVVEVETLRVRFDKASLPLSVWSVPKEVSAEVDEACVVTVNLCIAHAVFSGSAQKQPKVMSLFPLCLSQT